MRKPGKLNEEQRKAVLSTVRRTKTRRARVAEVTAKPEAPKTDFTALPGFKEFRLQKAVADLLKIENPFFRQHESRAGATTTIDGVKLVNFSSYDYLGLNAHADVMMAAKAGIDQYGISASASRVVGGERPAHRDLERKVAAIYDADDAVVFVSGHATNVSLLGQILQPDDLVLHDAFIHNSVMTGIKLAGVSRQSFPHNDFDSLERMLVNGQKRAKQILVAVEGVYSMDGDFPDLPRLLELKRKYRFWLMVDEAHSLGVLGPSGKGLADHFGVDPGGVDIWMGTFSKTLAGCGGYVAGSQSLIDYLKFSAPGFVFSVGMPPLLAKSISKALDIMTSEPDRVSKVQANGAYFLKAAQKAGFDTGVSAGYAVVPIMIGDSIKAIVMASGLLSEGVNVLPIIHPAVPEKSARLRFFMTSEHEQDQLDQAIEACKRVSQAYDTNPVTLDQLAALMG